MNEEFLIVVDEYDDVIGTQTRKKCHFGEGILHRAIASFVFSGKNELLIAQRSELKTLWPKFWDASCCTHVYPGEIYKQAGERRLSEELGFSCKLKFLTKFKYQARYKNSGSENEMCALLMGRHNGEVKPNPKEVAGCKWVDIDDLREEINNNPDKYTPWLKIALAEYLKTKGRHPTLPMVE